VLGAPVSGLSAVTGCRSVGTFRCWDLTFFLYFGRFCFLILGVSSDSCDNASNLRVPSAMPRFLLATSSKKNKLRRKNNFELAIANSVSFNIRGVNSVVLRI